MQPTLEEAAALLANDVVQRLEDQIASSHGVTVSRERVDLYAKIARDSVSASQLSCKDVYDEIAMNSDAIRDLAVQVLNADSQSPAEQDDGSIVLEQGDLGAGAGIGYAIYFHFLRNDDEPGLLKYLRALRIPSPEKFAHDLQRMYREVANAR